MGSGQKERKVFKHSTTAFRILMSESAVSLKTLERKVERCSCKITGCETMKGVMACKEDSRIDRDSEMRPEKISAGSTESHGLWSFS